MTMEPNGSTTKQLAVISQSDNIVLNVLGNLISQGVP